ncbi:MAG: hypothetical protein ABH872_02315 [Candidatus Omnitrophota bacterium]
MKEVIKQDIIIRAGKELVFNELVFWGESPWWPKSCPMVFKNMGTRIEQGATYLQTVKLPFGPKWHSRIKTIDCSGLHIRRVFLDGIFEGFEEQNVKNIENHVNRVEYTLDCEIKNLFDMILWKLFFRKLHIKNISMVLNALKNHIEKT